MRQKYILAKKILLRACEQISLHPICDFYMLYRNLPLFITKMSLSSIYVSFLSIFMRLYVSVIFPHYKSFRE